jgi:hypothetical protein
VPSRHEAQPGGLRSHCTLPPCLPACLPAVAFAAHTVNAARYPVAQPSFDRLLKAQLGGISDLEVSKAKAIALPIAYATLEER